MNHLLIAVLAAGAACMVLCVTGSPASNFEYGDLIFEFADNNTTPNATASTPSSSSNSSSTSPASPSANVTATSPATAGNATTPSTGNSTTPSAGNSTTPEKGNGTTPASSSSTSVKITTTMVTTTVAGNVTAAPSSEGFDAGSFFGGMGAMVGVVLLVGGACICLRRNKKGYNAM